MPTISRAPDLPRSALPKLPAEGWTAERKWPWNLSATQVRKELFAGHVDRPQQEQHLASDGEMYTAFVQAHGEQNLPKYRNALFGMGSEILQRAQAWEHDNSKFLITAMVCAASECSGDLASTAQDVLGQLLVAADEPTRDQILNAAHDLVLATDSNQGDPLSATVVYLGGRAPAPPHGNNGPGHQNQFLRNLQAQIPGLSNDALGSQYMMWDTELIAACKTLQHLNFQPLPVTLPAPGTDPQRCLDQFAGAEEALRADPMRPVALLANSDNGTPGAVKHWMQVVGTLDTRTDRVTWHVFNTDHQENAASRVMGAVGQLGALLDNAYPGSVKTHSHPMQEHAGNSCASLGYGIFKYVDDEVAKGNLDVGKSMDDFGRDFSSDEPETQKTRDLVLRMEIMQKAANAFAAGNGFAAAEAQPMAQVLQLPDDALLHALNAPQNLNPPDLGGSDPPALPAFFDDALLNAVAAQNIVTPGSLVSSSQADVIMPIVQSAVDQALPGVIAQLHGAPAAPEPKVTPQRILTPDELSAQAPKIDRQAIRDAVHQANSIPMAPVDQVVDVPPLPSRLPDVADPPEPSAPRRGIGGKVVDVAAGVLRGVASISRLIAWN